MAPALETYRSCHEHWEEVVDILTKSIEMGDVPDDYYKRVIASYYAAEAEITKIEEKQLEESEKEYKALTAAIKSSKTNLEIIKKNADDIVKSAEKAEQLVGLLSKLLPFLA